MKKHEIMTTKTMKCLLLAAVSVLLPLRSAAQTSLDECRRLARENYPLLKKYDLIRRSTDYTVSNIGKGYLPQLAFGGQATLQSDVMTLPGMLKDIMKNNGYDVRGLRKDQYRVALDLSQTLYDGGNIKAGKEVARREGEALDRSTDVDMYALQSRVDNLFFGILLSDNKLRLNEDLQTLLADNCRKLETMLKGGVAMQCDVDAVKAEYLNAQQQHTLIMSAMDSYVAMLSIFTGTKIELPLLMPKPAMPVSYDVARPELRLFDAQISTARARIGQVNAGLRPSVSLFAQGWYGYPGYDMYNDMFNRNFTLNGMIGVRMSWNIGCFYTQKNDKRKLANTINEIENAREVFLFNSSMQATEERMAVEHYRKVMAEDGEIIRLRTSVRMAAEAKLEHGIIDVNDLLQEITREHRARIDASTHEIELLKSIYELKNTLNQ